MNRTVPNNLFHPGSYKCAYCNKSTQQSKCLRRYPQTNWRFIFYCGDHRDDAERDILSILKKLDYHRQSDVLKHPVFEILPENLVKKGPWEIGTNWFLDTSLWEDSIDLVHKQQDGTWTIAIDNPIPNTATYIPVEHLKWSLPDQDHWLVDDLIIWLSNGTSTTKIIKRKRFCCCTFGLF